MNARGPVGWVASMAAIVVLGFAGCDDEQDMAPDGGVQLPPDGTAGDGAGPDGGVARLDPTTIDQFVEALVVPPVMPPTAETASRTDYEVAVRQFDQQILPTGMPQTTVWGYGAAADPATFNYPAFTIEARTGETVRVTWINDLVDDTGAFLPHLLPVDQTLHWANPPGPRDDHGSDPTPYLGPVPIVTHLHGGHVPSVSDGYPEAWWLPDATNIPQGYATVGTHFGSVVGSPPAGQAVFQYPIDQRASTLWYHDHALGITRLNVYAGLAGFFIVRDDEEDALGLPGPAPTLGEPAGTSHYEVPIAIQDRSFNEDGSLFYPASRAFFDGYEGPYAPETDVAPIWNPEFFGDTIVVNGRTWPYMEVEPRLYRLRLLNGSNSRFLILDLDQAGMQFHQIGNDGGLLPGAPLDRDQILLAPAERADVIVDFSGLAEGTEITMLNLGPDEPFKGPGVTQEPADPATTGKVMQFRVVAGTGQGTAGTIPATLPDVTPLTTALPDRQLTINEEVFAPADIPYEAALGTVSDGVLDWDDNITERPAQGTTETWSLLNLTEDAHPIHLHLVMFQVVDRRPFDAEAFASAQQAFLEGTGPEPDVADYYTAAAQPPEPSEQGWKDTVIANPGEVTRVIATFDLAGLYVWHCHILEHEDNEMMRPFVVE